MIRDETRLDQIRQTSKVEERLTEAPFQKTSSRQTFLKLVAILILTISFLFPCVFYILSQPFLNVSPEVQNVNSLTIK